VNEVENPQRYGLIKISSDGAILKFKEKPKPKPIYSYRTINSGIYLFNTSVLNRIEMKPTSIEREIFPIMAQEGQLSAYKL